MKALRTLLARLRPVQHVARPALGERADALARRAVERLSDDERLRGDLTDDCYGPLLAWVSDLLLGAARRSGDAPDAEAVMEAATASARALVAAVSPAAAGGDVAPVAAALAQAPSTLLTPDARARLLAALPRDLASCPSPGERARRLVTALAGTLPAGTS